MRSADAPSAYGARTPRPLALLAVLTCVGSANAQVPDVRVKLDGVYNVRSEDNGPWTARFYDTLGNRGVVGITLFLEPGFRAYLSQRLQPIRNDPDVDPFDEYYLEDEGLWRIGKQYLPFGSGRILRESVIAARGDTNLIFEGLPVVVAACDGGPGKQRGFVGRIGSRIGFSFALGNHFGIAATSLNYIRRPEDSPGTERGYRQAFGVDATKTFGIVSLRGEAVALRGGETAQDEDETVLDASVTVRPDRVATATVGVTRSVRQDRNYFRFGVGLRLDRNLRLEPLVRFVGRELYDVSLGLRFSF